MQNRLLAGDARNCSDEDTQMEDSFDENGVKIRRRKKQGKFEDDSEDTSDDSDYGESSDSEEEHVSRDDEYSALDYKGYKVSGRYTGLGFFIVDEKDLDGERCDKEGYLLDA